ncbi:MAG: DUF899 family protein [Pseudomonadales bacterium]|nr:DUF899 family protein [Pseudomonadales bacterium]
MANSDIQALEQQIFALNQQLITLRQQHSGDDDIPNYRFKTLDGETSLLELFGHNNKLLVIHNMGQACRYCTLWGDGFNGLLPHLESAMSVVMLSKDDPQTQRRFANNRGWRFMLASHGGGDYIQQQSVQPGQENMPGTVVYQRDGDKIMRKNACMFGPGDQYCSMWCLLGLAGIANNEWTPQFSYWKRPANLDDGGDNLID